MKHVQWKRISRSESGRARGGINIHTCILMGIARIAEQPKLYFAIDPTGHDVMDHQTGYNAQTSEAWS